MNVLCSVGWSPCTEGMHLNLCIKEGVKQMDAALIVSSTPKGQEFLRDLIAGSLRTRLAVAESGAEARRLLLANSFDFIFINSPLRDEFGHDLAAKCAEASAAGVLLVVKSELMDDISAKVERSGVFVLPKPVSRQIFYQSVKLMVAVHNRLLCLKTENVQLQQKIEEIRMVDRAKCALIQYLKLTEAQAHRYIEKQAMDLRLTRRDVAENILLTYEN